jgi:hypothetical protein
MFYWFMDFPDSRDACAAVNPVKAVKSATTGMLVKARRGETTVNPATA